MMEGILLRFCDMGHVGRLSRGKADGQRETAFLYSCWTPPLSISNSISARLDLSSACNIYFPYDQKMGTCSSDRFVLN